MIIAVDFDGTLTDVGVYPELGQLNPEAVKVVNKWFVQGHRIIIWTCRTGKQLLQVEKFLLENQVYFHKINDNMAEPILKYGDNCRKVYADVYVDDRQIGGLPSWGMIDSIVQKKQQDIEAAIKAENELFDAVLLEK